jgi:hypothetical protein
MFRAFLLILSYCLFTTGCKLKNQNEADLDITTIAGLINGSPLVIYLGEIDMDRTADCGRASVETAAAGAPGTTTPAPTTGGSSNTTNTRFAIVSTFQMKTEEILNLRYTFDTNQTQGPINAQQGFSLTGGRFGNSVTGRTGTVSWGNAGLNIDPKKSSQQLNFQQIDLNITGSFIAGNGTTGQPTLCFTLDSVNCTAGQAATQCFTVDNRTCLVDATSSEAKQVTIRGRITCSAPNIF